MKQSHVKITYSSLAEAIGVQKTYVSKVMSHKADLNLDQLFLTCAYLNFTTEQRQYLELLLNYSKASVKERKECLLKEIRNIQNHYSKSDQHLKAKSILAETQDDHSMAPYYLDPFHQIVHSFLTIPDYQRNPMKISSKIGLSNQQLVQIIQSLEDIKIIEKNQFDYLVPIKEHLQLSKDSPLCSPNQTLMRVKSTEFALSLPQSAKYNFSVTFSANKETQNQIQHEFMEFLKKIEKLVRNAEAQETYQLNFDLFPWSLDSD